jgi:hypothetical protein
MVHVDATIALPLITHGLKTGRVKRIKPQDTITIIQVH